MREGSVFSKKTAGSLCYYFMDLCHKCGTKCDRKNKGCTQIFLFNYITALLSICVEIFVGTLYYVTNTKNLELTSSWGLQAMTTKFIHSAFNYSSDAF